MRPPAALLGALLALSACRKPTFGAGFEGTVTIHTSHGAQPPAEMVVRIKGDKLRMETKGADGAEDAAIYMPDKQAVVMLVESTHSAMNVSLSGLGGVPAPGSGAPGLSRAQKTGKSETVAGVPCDDFVINDSSGKRIQSCLAQGVPYVDLASIRSPGGGGSWNRQMREAKLFPLRSVEYDATGAETSRSEVVSIDHESIDDALFQVPPGYHPMGMPVR